MTHVNLLDCKYKVGELLMVETQNEILIGSFKFIDRYGKVLELENVRDFNTNYCFTSTQILPRPLIKTIKSLNQDNLTNTTDDVATTSNSSTSSTNSSDFKSLNSLPCDNAEDGNCDLLTLSSLSISSVNDEDGKKPAAANISTDTRGVVNLSHVEVLKIQDLLDTTKFIFQTDQSYHKAIADIRSQFVVSLYIESIEFGRHSKTSVIAMATANNVYIFDIVCFGKVFREFKDILEAERPKKIVHYGHKTADHLKYRHNIALAGIFDTFVAHCLITKSKSLIDFTKCISRYFKTPEQYFTEDPSKLPLDPTHRPLSKEFLQLVAKKTIFTYKLYEHLLHEQMLLKFYDQCNNFSVAFSSSTDPVEIACCFGSKSTHGVDRIDENADFMDLLL